MRNPISILLLRCHGKSVVHDLIRNIMAFCDPEAEVEGSVPLGKTVRAVIHGVVWTLSRRAVACRSTVRPLRWCSDE